MPDFGIFRGFNEKLFGDKLYAGQLPTQLGIIGSQEVSNFIGLLDDYPNAAAAYSLRKLRSAYTGSAIEVRNDSGTHLDIGFVDNELDTATLLTHCGSGNGTVSKWYDQSGNARNAAQTTVANQPQIVSSGSVILDNGEPALKFDGSDDFFDASNYFNDVSYGSIFGVHRQIQGLTLERRIIVDRVESTGGARALVAYQIVGAGTGIGAGGRRISSNTFQMIGNQSSNTNQFLTSTFFKWNDALLESYINGNTNGTRNPFQTSGKTNVSTTGSQIGSSSANNSINGNIQELVIYAVDQSSNRTGIEHNINDFYSIY
jgi:hypothetical protein